MLPWIGFVSLRIIDVISQVPLGVGRRHGRPCLLGQTQRIHGLGADRMACVGVEEVEVQREVGKTIVMVTHDPKAASRAGRPAHLEKGVLVPDGGDSQPQS